LGIQSSTLLITPTLATKIVMFQFGQTNMDDLEEGIQPFSVAYRNPTDTRAAKDNAENYDLLHQGALGATMPDIVQFRETDKVVMPTTAIQVSATLRQYRVLLHMLLQSTQPLTREFDSFCAAWTLDETNINEVCTTTPCFAALVLRWLQLRVATWFKNQTQSGGVNVPIPDLVELLQKISLQEPWQPRIPPRYLANPTPAVPAQHTVPGGLPGLAPVLPGPVLPVPTPQSAVRNTAYNNRFAQFRDMSVTLSNVLTANPSNPAPKNANGVTMCVAYHVRGQCYSACRRKDDHRAPTQVDSDKLHRWCTTCFPAAVAARA
jgi:hypothetical protein